MILLGTIIKYALQLVAVYLLVAHTNASFWPKIAGVTDGACALQNNKLLSLLNMVCNATQNASIRMRDACYGCFFRAGNIVDGPTQLYSLNDCARLYIQESNYSSCAASLQAIVDGNRPTPDAGPGLGSFCYAGYCDFVRCIRRINTQQLISTCYTASLGTRQLTEQFDRIDFYTNITSCILARIRCSQFNPITGEQQNKFVRLVPAGAPSPVAPASTPPPFFNALQISDTGDLRVISFPQANGGLSDAFCADTAPLMQSGFDTYLC